MIVAVTGGRNYRFGIEDFDFLDGLSRQIKIDKILSGAGSGADCGCEQWAHYHNIPVQRFFPEWDIHGKGAGPIRNSEMSRLADVLIAFPGGMGTADMVRKCESLGLKIYRKFS